MMELYVFIKYTSPTAFAHYYMKKTDWEKSGGTVNLIHLISGVTYTGCQKSSLTEIKWDQIPMGYRMDAWHFNPTVRAMTSLPISQTEYNKHKASLCSVIRTKIESVDDTESQLKSANTEIQKLKHELSLKTKTEVDKYIDTLNDYSPFKQARIDSLTRALKGHEKELSSTRAELERYKKAHSELIHKHSALQLAINSSYGKAEVSNDKDILSPNLITIVNKFDKEGILPGWFWELYSIEPTHYGGNLIHNKTGKTCCVGSNLYYKLRQNRSQCEIEMQKAQTTPFWDRFDAKMGTFLSETTTQKNTEMNLSNVIPNFKFGKLSASTIALSIAGIAFKKLTNDIEGGRTASWVVFNKDTKQLIEVGDLKFDVDFYQIPVQTLSEGDVTILDGNFYIVEKINTDGSITAISPTTGSKTTKLARTNIFNMHFYTKVVSMFDLMGGQGFGNDYTAGSPFGNINPMMFMMMGDKTNGDSSNFMEMMMMSQLFNGNSPFNNTAAKKPATKSATTKRAAKTTSTKK